MSAGKLKKRCLDLTEKEVASASRNNQFIHSASDLLKMSRPGDIHLKIIKMDIEDKIEDLNKAIVEESYRKKWGKSLMDYLEEKAGHLLFVDSPPIHIIGSPALLVDIRAPIKTSSLLFGVRDILLLIKRYVEQKKGEIPRDWIVKSGKILIPTADLLRLRMKKLHRKQ